MLSHKKQQIHIFICKHSHLLDEDLQAVPLEPTRQMLHYFQGAARHAHHLQLGQSLHNLGLKAQLTIPIQVQHLQTSHAPKQLRVQIHQPVVTQVDLSELGQTLKGARVQIAQKVVGQRELLQIADRAQNP